MANQIFNDMQVAIVDLRDYCDELREVVDIVSADLARLTARVDDMAGSMKAHESRMVERMSRVLSVERILEARAREARDAAAKRHEDWAVQLAVRRSMSEWKITFKPVPSGYTDDLWDWYGTRD